MFFEVSNTQCMLSGKKQRNHPALFFDGHALEEVDEHMLFGVTFTSSMSWKKHIQFVAKAACQKLFILRRTALAVSPRDQVLVYKSYIRSKMECSPLLDECT